MVTVLSLSNSMLTRLVHVPLISMEGSRCNFYGRGKKGRTF
jgi:hypothetical protein